MGYTHAEAEKFIEYIAPMMVSEARKRGYNIVSTSIAQAVVEGAAGTSTLAKVHHNHFGMKAQKGYKGEYVRMRTKEEYQEGQLVTIYANFRKYPTDEAGIAGYYDFLQYKRYANLKHAKDYKQFAEYIRADGWATSFTYRDNLIEKVERYNLIRFDNTHIEYFPKYADTTLSIVIALESIGVDSSFLYREKIYAANYSDKYKGSEKQNLAMLAKLSKGQLIKP
jgi:flagellum-specific peptidoglycan hydrolase FlgJ